MTKHKNLLILLADGEHARLVRPNADHVLNTERKIDSIAAHRRSADLRSDHPGASYHSDSTAHHAMTPRHDPHELEKMQFAHWVAEILDTMPAGAFDSLVIAAPAHCLNAIRGTLTAATHAKLVGTLGKDLMKVPDAELWPHLKDFVPPPHPARYI